MERDGANAQQQFVANTVAAIRQRLRGVPAVFTLLVENPAMWAIPRQICDAVREEMGVVGPLRQHLYERLLTEDAPQPRLRVIGEPSPHDSSHLVHGRTTTNASKATGVYTLFQFMARGLLRIAPDLVTGCGVAVAGAPAASGPAASRAAIAKLFEQMRSFRKIPLVTRTGETRGFTYSGKAGGGSDDMVLTLVNFFGHAGSYLPVELDARFQFTPQQLRMLRSGASLRALSRV